MLATMLASLNQSILAPAIPTLVGELGGVSLTMWVLGAYFMFSTITMPIYGKIGDRIGRKPLLIVAISIFMGGAVIGALAQNMTMIIISRSLQGMGGGGLIILSQAALADIVPARQRGKYMGIMGAVFAVASVAGPLIGGWLTEGPGWRWAFWSTLPVGVVAILACVRFLPNPPAAERLRLDWGGMILLATATGCIILSATWGGTTFPWSHPLILALIGGALLATVAFVVVEHRTAEPIIPMSLFRRWNFNLATAGALLVAVAMFAVMGYLPTYLQMVHGVDATTSGLLMVPMMAVLFITSTTAGTLISRYGSYKWYPVGGTAIIAVAMVLFSSLRPNQPLWVVTLYLALMGLGLGAAMQIFVLIVQGAFPDRVVGTATAASNYFRQMGATLGSSVMGSLFAARLSTLLTERLSGEQLAQVGNPESFTPKGLANLPDYLKDPVVASYNDALTPIFLWIAPLVLLATVLLLFLSDNPLATRLDRDAPPETLATDRLGVIKGETRADR
jgi:EmrB/QacA subfamily drug resistance transporter